MRAMKLDAIKPSGFEVTSCVDEASDEEINVSMSSLASFGKSGILKINIYL